MALPALFAPGGVSAQRTKAAASRRIGVLWLGAASTTFGPTSREVLLRDTLRQLGWVEGRNLAVETRYVGDGVDPVRSVQDLLATRVDALVAMGSPIALAARHVTGALPVVFVVFGDPVEFGLIDSLARPGGNLTGIYMPTAEHAGKRLALLRDAVPATTRIAVFNFADSRARVEARNTQAAAQKLGVQLVEMNLNGLADLDDAFLECKRAGATALTVLTEPRTSVHLGRVAEMSLAHRLPSVAGYAGFAWLGGFMAYGADGGEGIRRAASFVARILDGARPADLPVEQSTRYVLALNIKTARTLGVRFPRALVRYANVVIS
ncbi:ABC transporter substrate-binding protein [Variovorax sp. J22R115]|uniref:ABC transporter substrate-binding protein n=1 Tax=Variovorax sp. J22R115 TaxID=3053509 RepID=UPI0025772B1E|nr:ABC transporter substrate-binding protein [Variovorax sp. J22R115]MDM0047800.1 ABC transporter substrate-binding protein [Variovorax sp. J22R115]